MANKLNMAIAKTHQVSTRLVGMQITAGNFIAIALSALQMTIGFIFLSGALIAGRWFMYVLVSLIGIALALLIERLSLGGLMAIRGANELIDVLEETHYQRLRKLRVDRLGMNELQLAELARQEGELKTEHERQVKKQAGRRGISIPVTIIGMALSATIGDLFWHAIFAPLKEWYFVYPLSVSCAGVIGLTFIYSELYKTIMDNSLGDIIRDNDLMKVTVANERETAQIDVMIEAFDRLKSDKELIKPAQARVRRALVTDLTSFADAVANGVDVLQVDGPKYRRKALPAPKKRTLYRDHKDAFAQFMEEHPKAELAEIQERFQIGRSTASDWRLQYEQEMAPEAIEGEVEEVDDAPTGKEENVVVEDALRKEEDELEDAEEEEDLEDFAEEDEENDEPDDFEDEGEDEELVS